MTPNAPADAAFLTLAVNEQVPRLTSAILPWTDLETSLVSHASSAKAVLFELAIAKDPLMNGLVLLTEVNASKEQCRYRVYLMAMLSFLTNRLVHSSNIQLVGWVVDLVYHRSHRER